MALRVKEVEPNELKQAVESQHGGTARLVSVEPVKVVYQGKTVWEGGVHIFDLEGHPRATRAYGWSSPIEGTERRRFFAAAERLETLSLALPPCVSSANRWPLVSGLSWLGGRRRCRVNGTGIASLGGGGPRSTELHRSIGAAPQHDPERSVIGMAAILRHRSPMQVPSTLVLYGRSCANWRAAT
jgi:hypothetical protein